VRECAFDRRTGPPNYAPRRLSVHAAIYATVVLFGHVVLFVAGARHNASFRVGIRGPPNGIYYRGGHAGGGSFRASRRRPSVIIVVPVQGGCDGPYIPYRRRRAVRFIDNNRRTVPNVTVCGAYAVWLARNRINSPVRTRQKGRGERVGFYVFSPARGGNIRNEKLIFYLLILFFIYILNCINNFFIKINASRLIAKCVKN